ncbi:MULTISPECIES: ABC transporter substrate-binding protein [Sphingobium]|jgi:sulfonate transport system substrate-binding protein|uniref:ABC transporter substrate-binding protein n=1 Tax=Sphingobium TaxID=165695 RepID=UPI000DBB4C3A|nr:MULTISPECIES: ABC transporter substrate-binding protein [Sphingobium]KAA9017828.1 ABC transporter substrate-binding protein [Sphingobium limneticum]MBU0932453.1 ABC transporter substrate-binding protein [Alphaproteobacteria bacterium]BBD00049.1 sulfonate transport system substrate-binding protein [Sphingobium sp. YG1]
MPKKNVVILSASLIAVAGLGLAAATFKGGDDKVLRVANQKGQVKSMMIASGVLNGAPYTVEWSEFPSAQPLLEAVGGGAADLGLAADAPFIFAYQSGSPVKAIGVQAPAQQAGEALAILVKNGSPLKSAQDLVGKSVATTRGSIGHHLLLQALERAHIPADKVRVTFLPPGDAKAAFDSGSIDAWAIWTPYTNVAIKEGARAIVDAKDYGLPIYIDIAHADSIAPKRALLADFLQREAKAVAWARAHPDDFAQVLAKETGLPLDIARASFDRNNRVSQPIDAKIIAHEQDITARFRNAGLTDGKRDVAQAFDSSFGKAALKQ